MMSKISIGHAKLRNLVMLKKLPLVIKGTM